MTLDELAQAARDDGWEVTQTTEAIEFRGFGRKVTYWTWTECLEILRIEEKAGGQSRDISIDQVHSRLTMMRNHYLTAQTKGVAGG